MVDEKSFRIIQRDHSGCKIRLYEDEPGREHPQIINFPAGEILVRYPVYCDNAEITVIVYDHTMDGLFALAQIIDIARHENPRVEVIVKIPYFPNARQDRRTQRGESFALKVYADFLNSLKADRVISLDPHSNVLAAVVNNFHPVDQAKLWVEWVVQWADTFEGDCVLVYPDAGAKKKTEEIAELANLQIRHKRITVQGASKDRDPKTGKLNISFQGDLSDCHVLIVDDICDGGGTFLGLANEISLNASTGVRSMTLAVTHGLYTKGRDIFKGHFTHLAEIVFTDSPTVSVTDFTKEESE